MAREHNTDVTNLEDQLADARSQIDSLQSGGSRRRGARAHRTR